VLSGAYNPRLGLGHATPTEAGAGGSNELSGEGWLFVGQSYLLEVPSWLGLGLADPHPHPYPYPHPHPNPKQVPSSAGVEPTRQVFRVEGAETALSVHPNRNRNRNRNPDPNPNPDPDPNRAQVLSVPLRRATCTLHLQLRAEQAHSGHWA
jgi:hypothetical protein